jgi:hypothetical protein
MGLRERTFGKVHGLTWINSVIQERSTKRAQFNTENQYIFAKVRYLGHLVADHQKDFSSVYKVFVLLFISSEEIAFPFSCIYC